MDKFLNFLQICPFGLVDQMVYILTPPLWIAANATGKVMGTQVWGRLFSLLALPISYCLLLIHKDPLIPMFVLIIAEFGYWIYCLFDVKRQLDINLRNYFKHAILPAVAFVIILIILNWGILNIYPTNDVFRFIDVCLSTFIGGALGCYALLEREEKQLLKNGLEINCEL